jgi:hypothetical protein
MNKETIKENLGNSGLILIVLAILIGSGIGYVINDQAKPARPEAQWISPNEKMPELDKTIFGLYRVKKQGNSKMIVNSFYKGNDCEKYLEAVNIKCTKMDWGVGKTELYWVFDETEDIALENLGPPIRWSELPILHDRILE